MATQPSLLPKSPTMNDLNTFSYMPGALLVVRRDLDIVSATRRGAAIFGVRLRRDAKELENLNKALQTEKALCAQVQQIMAEIHRPDAEMQFPWEKGERRYQVTLKTLGRGAAQFYALLFDDLTQQLLFEETQTSARRYLEDILNNIHLGVVVTNRDLRITNINRTQESFFHRLGVQISWVEAIGLSLCDLCSQDENIDWESIDEHVIQKQKVYRDPKRAYKTPEGDLFLSIEITPLTDTHGKVVGAIQVSEDVTKQVQQEQQLQSSLKALSDANNELFNVNRELEQKARDLEAMNQTIREERAKTEEIQRRLIGEMQRELQIAHTMQMDLLPKSPPTLDGLSLSGICLPARQVGGDYYTFIENADHTLNIVLADVSGKGMQAATVALRFNDMLRYEHAQNTTVPDILKGLDTSLRGQIPMEMFVTCGIGLLDPVHKTLTFTSSANPEVYHFCQKEDSVNPLKVTGLPLGLPLIIPGVDFCNSVKIKLESGDVMVFTSDGVEEAQNEHDEFYEDIRLSNLIQKCAKQNMTADEIRDAIVTDVTQFIGNAPQTDDLTVVVLRVE